MIQSAFDFISKNWAVIATILFFISELLADIPTIKSNSIFGLFRNLISKVYKEKIEKSNS